MAIHKDRRAILEALDEPALLLSGTLIVHANAAARELLGESVEGRDVRLAIRHPAGLEQILAGQAADVAIAGIGGADRPWMLSSRPAGAGMLLVRLIDRSALEAAEKMRVDFVANASHELRTPLATILGYAETIAEDGDLKPDEHSRFGSIIRSEARRMLRIVEDLLSLSRIEADRFVAPRDRIAPSSVATSAADRARPLAERRQCSVDLQIEPELPAIRGDESQFLQLLDNLLVNALLYGCSGPGCSVTLAVRRRRRFVEFSVTDTGVGIPREHIPRLTERFYRVDPARSRDSGGTGLGLAIVKHIAERHRATLEIISAPGEGTRVTLTVPVA